MTAERSARQRELLTPHLAASDAVITTAAVPGRQAPVLVDAAVVELNHASATARALSPQATLDRGYAVVRRPDGSVVRAVADASGELRVRVADGEFAAVVP
jgi:exonuclease VII large subunit